MTCIVAIKDKDNVWMGGDSLSTYGEDGYSEVRNEPKVFFNNGFLFGICGIGRISELLEYHLDFNKTKQLEENPDRWFRTSFTNAVRKCFKENGYMKIELGQEHYPGDFLVAYKNKLYIFDSTLGCGSLQEEYASVGIGAPIALGAMYAIQEEEKSINGRRRTPEERILIALEAAERYNATVRRPFTILHT